METLQKCKVAIFGIGGVGSYVAEGLVRAGISDFILVDKDIVEVTNINRQLIATTKTIGKDKVEVAEQRILEINECAKVVKYKTFFMPDTTEKILDKSISYIVDCIDTVTAKIELVMQAKELEIPIISCMGTGNKLEPTKLEVEDIYKTSVCPLAKVMRQELKKRDIKGLKVVYSTEEPIKPKYHEAEMEEKGDTRRQIPGSIAFVPSAAGMILASEVIKDLI